MKAENTFAPQYGLNLLRDLIGYYSPSGEESEAFSYLAGQLKAADFIEIANNSKFIFFTPSGLAEIETLPEILVLEAHIDVVGPKIDFSEDAEYIYGRGACDTKGSLACMVAAAVEAKKKGLKNFGLLFVADEEIGFSGSKAAAEFFQKMGLKPFFVIGEPTSLQPINGNFGCASYWIETVGVKAHSSEPRKGFNAINRLILKIVPQLQSGLQPKGKTKIVYTQIEGGIAFNIVPDRARLGINIRQDPKDQQDYRALLEKIVGADGRIIEVENVPSIACPMPSWPKLGTGKTARFCSDLAYLKNGFILGPGEIEFAHKDDERILKADLARAIKTYLHILYEWNLKGS